MKLYNQSLFKGIKYSDIIVLCLYSAASLFLSLTNQSAVLVAFSLAISLVYIFTNQGMSFAILVIATPFLDELSSGFYVFLVYVPFVVVTLFKALTNKKDGKITVVYILCVFLVLFSFLIGYDTDAITLFIQFVSMTIFYSVWKTFTEKDVPVVAFAYICSALAVLAYIWLNGFEDSIVFGRLTFGENVKRLTFICAIPLSFSIYSYIGRLSVFENLNSTIYKLIQLFVTLILIVAVFMTLARGVFLALGIGVIVLLMFSKNKTKTYFFFLIAALIVFYISQYISSLDMFRVERLMELEEYSSGNGRTEIWSHYINRISEMGPQYVIFGVGPGNVSRISNIEFYAHSTFLDYYFSYGIVGLITFLSIEGAMLMKLYKAKNKIPFVIAVAFLFAYATHGGAANLEMFMLQSILVANVNIEKNENLCITKLV